MKKFTKTLALCAIAVLVIAAIFNLSACKKNPKVESISVEIIGGGEKIELTQADATVEKIIGKINVVAQLTDKTTKTVTDYTVEGFVATKLDTVQTVTIKYDEFTATVSVVVKSPAPVEIKIVSIAVAVTGGKVTLQQNSATAAAILDAITVTATYDDNSTKPVIEDLTIENFDATKLDEVQTVTVKYGTLTATVSVEVKSSIPDDVVVTDINVTIDGDKVTMSKETASEQVLRSNLTVTAVKSDNSTETITDYTVIGLDLTKVNADQSVTIKYGDFTKTVTVYVEDNSTPEPYEVYVIVNGVTADKVTLVLNPDPSNESGDLVSEYFGDVTLEKGDTVEVKDSNGTVIGNYEDDCPFKGTADKDGVHTFYVKTWKSGWINIWVTEPADVIEPTVTALTTNVTDTLVLYGVKANDIKAALVVTATWNAGDPTVVAAADYKITNYDKTLLDDIQTVTISYGGKNVQISVQVKAALVVSISATHDGEVIELIGVNATKANILNAIVVTATYNDETTSAIETEQLTVDETTFDATSYDAPQQVKICLGEINTAVPVKVTAATPESIELDTESVNAIGANEEEVVADIKDKLTVRVIMTDGTSGEITNYTVTLAENFDFADFTTEQSATITCGDLTATVAVHMIKQPKSISVDKNEVSISETVSDNNAKITALKKAIVVTLTSTDDSAKTVTDYAIKLGELDVTTYTQTATISYKGLEETLTVTVKILPVPKISVKGGAAMFMTVDPDNANTYLCSNVQLKRGETVAITLAGKAVAMPANFNGTADLNGAYSFAVTVDGLTGTITATVPEYTATLKVGDVAQDAPTVENGVYTWQVILALDDEITVSDNRFGNIKIGTSLQYVATRSGQYTITVTPQDDKTVVDVTKPAYAVTLTVKRGGEVVNTVDLTENADTDKEDGRLAEYCISGLTLQKGDKVTIADNEGNTLGTYENCAFNGTAPRDGDYAFYVKIYEDRNSIWVNEPAKVVTITVSGGTPVTLARHESNKEHEEYMVEGLALTADDTVVIKLDGDKKSNYKSGCKFNGTVYLTGNYDFYVCVDGSTEDGIWVNDWVQVYHERNGNITIVPTEESSSNDGRVKEQRKAEVALLANDKIVVRDIGGNAFAYENFGDFNGTANKDGIYTFYIKIGWERANDIVYTQYDAPVATALTTNVDGALVLYGVQADDIKAALTVTAMWNVGDPSEVTNYVVTDFDKTTLNVEQTVTLTLGDASVEITVKVAAAYIESIDATISGDVIELIGAKATAENILKAITAVTATLNDGTTRDNVKSQCTVDESSFNATQYGTTQQVKICIGEINTTVPVKVTEATASELVLSSQSVTVTGANESEVIAAIKAKITVNIIMTDDETVLNATYTVALATGFDFANVTTAQSATITCSGLIGTISVKMIMEPKSIAANVNAITILESSATETARLAAVKAQLVVTLTMTDNSTDTITDYAVDFGSFDASDYAAQTVTLSYEGVESVTIQVTVTPVPKISVKGGAATFMTVDPTNANRYLSGDVELESGDAVAITLAGQAATMPANFNGTATLTGTHTFAVTVSGTTATVEATLPAYVATLKVGGVAQGEPTVANGVYTWTVTLERGNTVTITDNKFGNLQIEGSVQYAAGRSGQYTITATPGNTSTAVNVTVPAYAVTLTVTRDGAVVNKVALTLSTEKPANWTSQYQTTQLELNKDDVVTITDNEGNALANYENFNGTVPHNGKYDFYVKVNSGSNSIWVAIPAAPDKVVTISVDGGDPVALVRKTDNTEHEEYMITGFELHAGESVVILVDDVAKSNYKDCGFDGTAEQDGTYDFYVCVDGSTEDGIWVNYHAPEVPGTVVTLTVNNGDPTELPFDETKSEYVLEGLMLHEGDTVVVKKNGVVVDYRDCGFDGTVAATGYHDFYVGDQGVWVTTAYRKLYFNNQGWDDNWSRIKAYCYTDGVGSNANWPGKEMTRLADGSKWFVLKVDVKFNRAIFVGLNVATGEPNGNRTPEGGELTIDTTAYDLYMVYNNNTTPERPTEA